MGDGIVRSSIHRTKSRRMRLCRGETGSRQTIWPTIRPFRRELRQLSIRYDRIPVGGQGRLRGVGGPSLLGVMMLEGRWVGAPWLIVCSRRICQAMRRLRRNAMMHLRGRRAGVRRERLWLIVRSNHFDNGRSAPPAGDSRLP